MADTNKPIPLWPAGAPGTEQWSQLEQETPDLPPFGIKVVRNVTQPTLTPFLPEPAMARGTAAIVCPGGAFHFLAIDHEGYDVADWLTAHGVAAFVLKYRVVPTAVGDAEFMQQMRDNLSHREQSRERMKQVESLGVADALQAMQIVRQRAAEWKVRPEKIGILGFSAGAMISVGVALRSEAASRPSFVAPIYGAPREGVAVPADAPPLFMAVADDDEWAAQASLGLYSAWKTASRSAELHIYAQGGHGFGMRKNGLPSDHWIERFDEWLQAQSL